MFPIRSFRSRLLLALLAVGLVPAMLTLGGGTFILRQMVEVSGTAGPWDQVARSGRALLDAVEADAGPAVVEAAAERHREALSESVRLSRVYALLADRFLGVLPLFALAVGLSVAGLAYLSARVLTAGFARPVQEIVEWTRRIARSEPLPPPMEDESEIREFVQLREALRTMAGELREAREREVEGARLRSWTQMARRVAHEIKNPLTPMRMAAATVAGRGEPAVAEAGAVLLEEIGRLDRMARSFSQMGRLPEGPTSEVDLRELVEGLARLNGDDGATVEVRAPEGLPRVRGRYDALGAVFRNLLSNALEASEGAGREPARVRIDLEALPTAVEVRVRDWGPGIPEEALERIWQPEYTTRRRGTGIGLPLVRQTVRAHGGSVQARNAPGGGAEFVVRLSLEGPPDEGTEGR